MTNASLLNYYFWRGENGNLYYSQKLTISITYNFSGENVCSLNLRVDGLMPMQKLTEKGCVNMIV